MGSLLMCFSAALAASLCAAAPVSDSLEVLVRSPVSVHRGHTTTLPCWLNPPQSAEGLEVRWFRGDNFDNPVMLYRAKKFASQEASYVGRVQFGPKDATSGGLTEGDVSLRLVNATLEDAGDYTCYVSSDQGYDSARVSLTVTETGTPLLLSAVCGENNMMNVSCESGGWYPQPSLRWSDQKQVLSPKGLKYSKDSSGLLSVHSWLLVSRSSEVSCSVGLSGQEAKEARVRLNNPPEPESRCSVAGWVAFTVLLIAILAVLGVLYFKKRTKKTKSGSDHAEDNKVEVEEKKPESGSDHAKDNKVEVEENQQLLSKEKITDVIKPTDLSTAKKHYVNVTLDKTENQYLTIRDDCILEDTQDKSSPGDEVTCLTAIKGTPGFSSGQHYWEVSMKTKKSPLKQSWWLGVTSETVIPQESDFSPNASNGFWFLSSSPERGDRLQFSTEPKVLLPVCSRATTVGVYLNYDSGELSFYNVEKKQAIGSVTVAFTSEVFPFFNPGINDKAPMVILQKKTEERQIQETSGGSDQLSPMWQVQRS